LRGRHLIMAVNQNVPGCAPSGGNNGCRPNPAYANNSQYSSVASSVYDALLVSFTGRPRPWAFYRVSYVLSTSMNNVGEAFFNQPIDAFDLSKDWGRSDDDQRHRLVVNGTMMTRGFQITGVLQYYSALPYNITSGVTTIQGTAGRPIVDGAFIERNAGEGDPFLAVNLRLSRSFVVTGRAQVEGVVEAFNVLNRRNNVAFNTSFGAGAYPSSPSASFGQVTAVAEPRTVQLGLRVRF
jgi:hypothetical protein